MKIRRLTINDYDKMTRLWTRANLAFRPKARDSREAIANQMVVHPGFFLGAFEDDSLVGIAILSSDVRKGWINRLAVDPNHRRHGIAKALIKESEEILRKHGVKLFCALVDDDNTASKDLFRTCDYVEHRDIIYFSKRENEEV